MAGYTKQNLKEVEDQAPKFGLSPDLEARFARVALEVERELRGADERRDAHGRQRRVEHATGGEAQRRGDAGPAALAHPAREDIDDVRPGRDREQGRGNDEESNFRHVWRGPRWSGLPPLNPAAEA